MNKYIEPRKKGKKEKEFLKQKDDTILRKKRISSIKKLISTDNLSKALSETELYLSDYPNDSFGLFQHANILWLLGLIEESKKEFQYIIDHELESKYSSIYKLGVISLYQGQLEEAAKYFKYNIENSPYEEILAIRELSNLELEKGNYEEAYNVLEKYSNMENDQIILQGAYVLSVQEKYEEAYEMIMNHNFLENPYITNEYYKIKGIIEIGLKKYEEAEKSLIASLESLNNEKSDIYYKIKIEMAYLYYQQRKYQQAMEICFEVLNTYDKRHNEKIMIILGKIFQNTGRYEEANKYYLESAQYENSKERKGYFYAGNIYMIKKEYDKAKKYYEKYLETVNNIKNRSKTYLKLALISAKEGKIDALEKNLKKIRQKDLIEIDLEDYKCLKTHLCYMKNIPIKQDSYRIKQLFQYSLDELVNHINRLHISYDKDEKSYFNDKIDLEELVCQIPELLSNADRTDNHYFERYQVLYPNIGYVNGELTDTLELVVFPESQKVLTMFPVKNNDYLSGKKITKHKQKSQIDKFNQRYGKKSEN